MDAMEPILRRILEDARREAAGIEAQAQKKAQSIRKHYEEQAQQECGDILRRGERIAEEQVERQISAARLEGRKLELAARRQVLSQAFGQAVDKLCALPEEDYTALLTKLAERASQSEREELILSDRDRARVGQQVVTAVNRRLGSGRLVLSQQTRPIRGGFVMRDGPVEVNCAFEMLVRMRQEQLEKEVADILFA